jgi:hypothetical protein
VTLTDIEPSSVPSRLLRPALVAAVLVAAVPSAAWAADATLREPADAVVTGATRLVVQVATTADERVERIDATLRRSDGELTADARHPLCRDAEDCARDRADHPIDFDPRTGAPFLPQAEAQILANGDYVLRVVVTGAEDAPPQTVDLPLTLSAPGTAPSDLRAAATDGEVLLSWDAAPEPDVSGYLVERADGTGWALVAEVPAEAESLIDFPDGGLHAYRVVTLRPDGRGATYETVSREITVEVDGAGDTVTSDESTSDAVATPPASDARPSSGGPTPGTGPAVDAAPTDGAPTDDDVARGGNDRSAPGPGASFTARTVTEDGELVLGASSPPAATSDTSGARLVAPALVGLLFVSLAVRVYRRGRPVHRPLT